MQSLEIKLAEVTDELEQLMKLISQHTDNIYIILDSTNCFLCHFQGKSSVMKMNLRQISLLVNLKC